MVFGGSYERDKNRLFRCLYYSVTSFSKYRLFLRHSTGRVVAYLMLLSFLAAISVSISWFTMANEIIDAISVDVIENIPEFNFENGKLDVYAEMPIVIDGNVPVVIDTRPGINEEQILYQYDNVILITRDKMIQKSYLKREELSWSMYGNMTMNRESLVRIVPMLKSTFVVVSQYSSLYSPCYSSRKFISALIVSLIGGSQFGQAYDFLPQYIQDSVYSMTLPLIAGTILNILHINVPYLWALFYIVSGVYVIGAINSIKRELDAMYGSSAGLAVTGGPGGYGSPGGFGDSGGSGNDDFKEEENGYEPDNNGNSGDQNNDSWHG